ncbi:MAG: chromosomal replication initiator protein DnaA [Tannerella sp.]|jgi:chromosomal replication initiator protein|nr:chromosomal replication initiator protein DnaA [Tannerella sp.]
MQKDSKQLWAECLAVIKDIVPQATYKTWFLPIEPLSYEGNKFTIQVPTQFFYEYLEANLVNILKMTLKRVFGENITLKYRVLVGSGYGTPPKSHPGDIVIAGQEPEKLVPEPRNKQEPTKAPGPFPVPIQDFETQLIPRYNFDNFYEGLSNRLVRAVSLKIASEPGKTAFNPLFIYGASGVGKTHLCHAIGVKIRDLYPTKRVLYASSNLFRLQYTDAVRKNSINDFLSFYQSLDVLILDDIHELIGLNKTQETFFQIFNNLHQLGKQLILTCDRAPVDLQGMEERLISRLKWGMTAQLERPELELRKKILRNKIELEGLEIPDDVFDFIAENVTENVRDLEGVLVSLMANTVVAGKEIDLSLAKQVISQSIRLERKQLTIKAIQEIVCRYFNINESLIHTKSRKREIVQARQITMYFSKKYTDSSLAHIGKVVGGKDHATVLYAIKMVEDQMAVNKPFKSTMTTLETCLRK